MEIGSGDLDLLLGLWIRIWDWRLGFGNGDWDLGSGYEIGD